MNHMSNLYCPNCDHLIGSLKPAQMPADGGTRDAATWATVVGWEGWKTSGEVYGMFKDWAADRGMDVLTQRTFTTALVDGGAKVKSSNRGRLYLRS